MNTYFFLQNLTFCIKLLKICGSQTNKFLSIWVPIQLNCSKFWCPHQENKCYVSVSNKYYIKLKKKTFFGHQNGVKVGCQAHQNGVQFNCQEHYTSMQFKGQSIEHANSWDII